MILTTAFVFLVVLVVAVFASMLYLAWPAPARESLYETETPTIVVGYWTSAIVPPVGFVIGLITAFRDGRHGLLIAGVSIVATVAYGSVLFLFLTR